MAPIPFLVTSRPAGPYRVDDTPSGFRITAKDGTVMAYIYCDERPVVGTGAKMDRITGRAWAEEIAKLGD